MHVIIYAGSDTALYSRNSTLRQQKSVFTTQQQEEEKNKIDVLLAFIDFSHFSTLDTSTQKTLLGMNESLCLDVNKKKSTCRF